MTFNFNLLMCRIYYNLLSVLCLLYIKMNLLML